MEEGKKLKIGEEKRKEEEWRGSGLETHPSLTPRLNSPQLPPFGNFSKAPVMAFEAAIKNKCFFPPPPPLFSFSSSLRPSFYWDFFPPFLLPFLLDASQG